MIPSRIHAASGRLATDAGAVDPEPGTPSAYPPATRTEPTWSSEHLHSGASPPSSSSSPPGDHVTRAVQPGGRFAGEGVRRAAPAAKEAHGRWTLLLGQFASPIVLILLGATTISLFLQDFTDAAIILVIELASCLLEFWQERGATRSSREGGPSDDTGRDLHAVLN